MAITFMSGAEAQNLVADGLVDNGGPPTYSTTIKRTGAASIRCNAASGANASFYPNPSLGSPWVHFGFYVVALPSVARQIYGTTTAGNVNVRLNPDGTFDVYIGTTLVGTSSQTISAATWVWIGIRSAGTGATDWLQINGVDAFSAAGTTSSLNHVMGLPNVEASAMDCYFDDLIYDDAGFVAPSKVALLVPTADSAVGTGWTRDNASATGLWQAVDNQPPAGVADTTAGTGLHQIRNATSNASVNYDATLMTYSAAGLVAGDTIIAVQAVVATAAPVATSSKAGRIGLVSNPAIATVALGAAGSAGAFWSGVAAGTYPTGWKTSFGTVAASPSVTLGTAPVARVTQTTSSTRIAMVAFVGALVAWTPPGTRYGAASIVLQAMNRAATR